MWYPVAGTTVPYLRNCGTRLLEQWCNYGRNLQTFIEKLCEYVKTTHSLLKKDFFFLINCAAYLRKCEYDVLEEFTKTEGITILVFDTREYDDSLDEICEKHIVDNDLCELYL